MKTRNFSIIVVGVLFLLLSGFVVQSEARVDVHVGINLPGFVFPGPPHLAVIPGTYAYFAPDVDVEVLFYQGWWYRPYSGGWYRSRNYNGPWGFIKAPLVPRVFRSLPPDYRHVPPGHRRIPHDEFNRSWKKWERSKYWERDRYWRERRHDSRKEIREERREDRRERRDEMKERRHDRQEDRRDRREDRRDDRGR